MEAMLKTATGWLFAAMAGVCLMGGMAVIGYPRTDKKNPGTKEG